MSDSFKVRKSGFGSERYYIDYEGKYEIEFIEKLVTINESKIQKIYENNNGEYNEELNVYYFPSVDKAKVVISELYEYIKPSVGTKPVPLTNEEMEYIRKAIIRMDDQITFKSSELKDSIFNKLNR